MTRPDADALPEHAVDVLAHLMNRSRCLYDAVVALAQHVPAEVVAAIEAEANVRLLQLDRDEGRQHKLRAVARDMLVQGVSRPPLSSFQGTDPRQHPLPPASPPSVRRGPGR